MKRLLLLLLCLIPLYCVAENFHGRECQTVKSGKSVTVDVDEYLTIWYYVDKSKNDFCWFEVRNYSVNPMALYRVYAMHDDTSLQVLDGDTYTTVYPNIETGWHLFVVSSQGVFLDGASIASGRDLNKVVVEVPEYSSSMHLSFKE